MTGALDAMPQRPIGLTGARVTALGFGGASAGNLYTETTDADAAAAVDRAWAGGIRYFDTAPHYGLGLSERRLGAALRDRPRELFVISTICERHGVWLPDAAIQFPLRHPAVVSVVSGMRSGGQAASALDRFATVVPDEAWTELDAC